ncbi:MAG TPA: GIY-YIG nuclease family protein [Terriglobales bacterium]|nr:GIY-YIG nuclease family protein [Terriglobales bacterium]
MSATDFVYLLHFEPDYRHAAHYLGSANDVEERVKEHVSGQGSPLVKAAVEAGCRVEVARVWEAAKGYGRRLERRLKDRKESTRLCPKCLAKYGGKRPPVGARRPCAKKRS